MEKHGTALTKKASLPKVIKAAFGVRFSLSAKADAFGTSPDYTSPSGSVVYSVFSAAQ